MSRFQSNNCTILETRIMNTAVKMPFVHVSLRSFKIQNQNWQILNMSCLYIYAYRWIAQEYMP